MATVKFLNSIFEKDYETFSIKKGTSIENIIREHVDENVYDGTLVECYDLETGKTYFAPIEENTDSINAIIQVNGKDVSLDYEVQENDIVEIVITPAGDAWSWTGAITGAVGGGFLGYQAGGWIGALFGGIVGFLFGGVLGGAVENALKPDENATSNAGIDSEKLPDVRGATNQPLTNQPIPMVLGKHLAVPFIIGSPFNDISGTHGEENYISVLYVVGYGPLRLTDFKLGDQILAHNQRWSGNPDLKNIWSGTIKGTDSSSGSGTDAGEIANIWKNNDVTLEILQQTPSQPVNYGSIYPYAKLQNEIKVNVLFIADGTLEEIDKGNNISYKGLGLQNGLRNNPIYFSEQFAKSLKVELDFANGLYKTRSETVNKESNVHYAKIPMWVAIQWRVFSEDNDKADGNVAGTVSIPNYNYNTHRYDLIDNRAQRGWNTFKEINSVNMGWDDNSKPHIDLYYNISYNADTTSANYGYTLTIKYLKASTELSGDFTIKVEYKRDNVSSFREYTFPANTTRMDINETIFYPNLESFVGYRVISVSPSYGGGSTSSTSSGYNPVTSSDEPLAVCVGSGIKSKLYTAAERTADFAAHTGNDLPADLNSGWLDNYVFNLEELGGDDVDHTGINEFRCTTDVDLIEWAEENLRASGDSDEEFVNKVKSYFFDSSNTTRSIEVRVVRVSPNYLDETVSTNEHSAYKFNDMFTWTNLTSTMLDGDQLLKENKIVQKRPLPEEDMRKVCVVALKAKTDNIDQLSSTIQKFSCVAEAFAPYYDDTQKKWLPENVVKTNKYVQLVTVGNKKEWQEITQARYYEMRQDPSLRSKAKCLPAGNNFVNQIITNVIDISTHRDDSGRIYIPNKDKENGSYKTGCDGTLNYCCNNVASVFLYAGIGPHLGNDTLGYSQNNYDANGIGDFNMLALTKWFQWAEKRTDGSTYTYSGYHYDHEGNEVPHNEGDIVEVYFTANAYVYQTEMLESILANIAIAGQSVYTRDTKNRLTVVIDKVEKYPVALINQKNTLKSSYSISFAELPSGIQVTFPDENDGFEQNQIYRMVDGEDEKNPLGAIEQYSFKYVTNNNQIWFLAGYVLANRVLNREVVTKQLGMEGASISLGDIVLVQDDTMLIGTDHGGRITQLIEDDNYIYGFIIDDMYQLKGDANFGVVVMQPSKFKEYRIITLRIASIGTTKTVGEKTYTAIKGTTNTVLFETNIAKSQFDQNGNDYYVYKPEVGNIVSFGTIGSITAAYRVIKIKPSEKQKYDFTLIKYTEELYTCGDRLPSFQNNMTLPDRRAENSYPLSNNVTQDQLVKAITESTTQAKGMIEELLGSTPDVPSNLALTVDRDSLHFSCMVNTSDVNSVDYVEYVIKRKNNSTITLYSTYDGDYLFNRNIDQYPEREDLADWTIKARAVSIFTDEHGQRLQSNWTSEVHITTASLNNYGTWIPAIPSFSSKEATEGGIELEWNIATGSNNRQLYGTNTYEVDVKYNNTLRKRTRITDNHTIYNFVRTVDSYPEKPSPSLPAGTITLDNYTVKLTVINSSGNTSYSADVGINYQNYKTWIPSQPTVTKSLAERDGISFEWTDNSDCYGSNYYTVVLTGAQGTVPAAIYTRGFVYVFDRETDGYPEASDFSTWKITVTAVNGSSGRSTTGVQTGIETFAYLTWIPPNITVHTEIIDRTVVLTALYNANLKFYGNLKTLLKIKRFGNNDIARDQTTFNEMFDIDSDDYYYLPEFQKSVQTVPNADNEPNYKADYPEVTTVPQSPSSGDVIFYKGTTTADFEEGKYYKYDGTDWNEISGAFESNGYKVTHTLPLLGQTWRIFKEGNVFTGTFTKDVSDSATIPQSPTEGQIIHYVGSETEVSGVTFNTGFYYLYEDSAWQQVYSKALIVPTTYYYSMQLTNESGNVSNLVTDIEATALCTNIADIVHSHEHYKDLYVEKLSAINANLGLISQGGLGQFEDWKNFWALSDLSPEDSGVAGGVKKGSFRVGGDDQFLEVMPDPDHEGEYLITLQAGNITLTSGSDASFRQGTYIYDSVDPTKRLALTSTGIIAQQNVSQTSVENWVNMAEVRTDELGNLIITNSDDAPVVGVKANGTIYHFDDPSHPFYEEGGSSNPQGLSGNGTVVEIDNNAIIKKISSEKCYQGTVEKDVTSFEGTMLAFSKANLVQINKENIFTNGTITTDLVYEYNQFIKETKDIGTVGSYLGLSQTQIDNGIFAEE